MRKYIDIVFAAVKDSPDCTFVEVEDERGFSIQIGAWVKRDDGYSALRLYPGTFEDEDPTPYCSYGHKTKASCNCGPIAAND